MGIRAKRAERGSLSINFVSIVILFVSTTLSNFQCVRKPFTISTTTQNYDKKEAANTKRLERARCCCCQTIETMHFYFFRLLFPRIRLLCLRSTKRYSSLFHCCLPCVCSKTPEPSRAKKKKRSIGRIADDVANGSRRRLESSGARSLAERNCHDQSALALADAAMFCRLSLPCSAISAANCRVITGSDLLKV